MTGGSLSPEWLRSVADVLVPAVAALPGDAPETAALRARSASDLGVDELLAVVLPGTPRHVRIAVEGALAALPADFRELPLDAATPAWRGVGTAVETAFGAYVLQSTACAAYYTAPVVDGRDPGWPALGYSGVGGVERAGADRRRHRRVRHAPRRGHASQDRDQQPEPVLRQLHPSPVGSGFLAGAERGSVVDG